MPAPSAGVTRRDGPTPILFVHHAGINWIRGSTRCLLDLLTHIDRSRFLPVVWCNQPAILDAVRSLNVVAHDARDWVSGHPLRPDRQWIADAGSLIREHDIRLVHADEFTQASVLLRATRQARIPLVAQLHQVPTADERLWSLLHQVDRAVGTSQACLTGLIQDGFPADQAVVIYNGVDPARLDTGSARDLRTSLAIPADTVVITLVGSLIPRKAVDVALRALGRMRAATAAHLLICGSGPERQALEQQAQALGVQARITFLGECSQVGAILRDATDVLLAPSRDESFGLTLAEAGLFGVPAVASDIPAHAEVVGDTGLVVPVEDHERLAAALDRIVDDTSLRRQLGERARQRVMSLFLIDRYVRDFEQTYADLVRRPAAMYGWRRGIRWPRAYNVWIREALTRRLLGRASLPGTVNERRDAAGAADSRA